MSVTGRNLLAWPKNLESPVLCVCVCVCVCVFIDLIRVLLLCGIFRT